VNINPVIAEVTRGSAVESVHRGSFAIADAEGRVGCKAGDITTPIFPRSAIKAFQCVPLIESGAADRFGLTAEEIALCCASHNGEDAHVRAARSILHKSGVAETCLACGAHMPYHKDSQFALIRSNEKPQAIHNTCSGKHAGMLALATHMGIATVNYGDISHPVQLRVASTLDQFCDIKTADAQSAIDGCSLPTWAMPLKNLAMGFARLVGHGAGDRIIAGARSHPAMIAGSKRFDTEIMQAVPRLFIKLGAEGVYCGCIPHAQVGFALKCDDGATRGAEVAIVGALLKLDVWSGPEILALSNFTSQTVSNWNGIKTGEIRSAI
jgi:L-asparaginase II